MSLKDVSLDKQRSRKAILDMRNDVGKGLETGKYKYLEEKADHFLL